MQIFRKSLLLTAALALTAFAACSNDDNENGGDGKETDPDYLALPHAYGTYYHTYWGDAAGDYYLVLTDAASIRPMPRPTSTGSTSIS